MKRNEKNGDVRFVDGQEFLSLQEASKYTPHSQEYLRLLARNGRLESRKLGRNWYTTRAWLADFFGDELTIPVKEESGTIATFASLPEPVISGAPIAGKRMLIRPALTYLFALALIAYVTFLVPDVRIPFVDRFVNPGVPSQTQAPIAIQPSATSTPTSSTLVSASVIQPPTQSQLIGAIESFFSKGLPADLVALLKGPKGDVGEQGPTGVQGPTGYSFGSVIQSTSNTGTGTVGGVSYFGTKELTTQTLTVTGNSTLSSLYATGGTFSGSLTGGTASFADTTVGGNLEVSGYASSSQIFGAGLADCDVSATSKLLWDETTGLFSCGTDQTGGGGGGGTLELREGLASILAATATISFDGGHFDITASGSTEAVVKLDWVNGPASRAMANMWSALNVFSAGASVSSNLEVAGTASISALTIGGTAFRAVTSDSLDFDELVDAMTLDANLTIASTSSNYTWDFLDTQVSFAGGRIMPNGYVGIGTTAPLTKLEVQGTASASHLLTTGGLQVAGGASASYSRFGTATTGHGLAATSDALISGLLEVNGDVFFDANASISSRLEVTGRASISYAAGTGDSTLWVTNAGTSATNSNIIIARGGATDTATMGNNARIAIIQTTTTNGNFGGISFFNGGGGRGAGIFARFNDHDSAPQTDLVFSTSNNATEAINMILTQAGNLGIGTGTTADSRLEVSGLASISHTTRALTVATGTGDPLISLFKGYRSSASNFRDNAIVGIQQADSTAGNYANLLFYSAGGQDAAGIGTNFRDGDSTPIGDLYFATNNNAGGSTIKSILTAAGDWGVGDLTPEQKLTVAGTILASSSANSAFEGILLSAQNSGTATSGFIEARNGTTGADSVFMAVLGTGYTTSGGNVQDGGVIGANSNLSGGLSIVAMAAAPMRFYTGGNTNATERMRIDSTGNVGIGETTPETKLDVGGRILASSSLASAFEGLVVSNQNSGTNASTFIEARNGPSDADSVFMYALGTGYTTSGANVQDGAAIGTSTNLSGGLSIVSVAAAPIRFYTAGTAASNERMRIDSSGNVGIGTADIGSKLEVAGTASISGTTTLAGVTYTWPSAQGAASTVLTNNGSGTLTWSAVTTVASDGLDFDELVDAMTLDANLTVASGGYSINLGNTQLTTGLLLPDMTGAVGTQSAQFIGDATHWWSDIYVESIHMGSNSLYVNGIKVLAVEGPLMRFTADVNQGLSIETSGSGNMVLRSSDTGNLQLLSDQVILASSSAGITLSVPVGVGGSNINITNQSVGGDITLNAAGTGSNVFLQGVSGIYLTAPAITLTGDTEIIGTASVSALLVNGVAITAGSAVASDGLDFDELVDAMTLDANLTIASTSSNYTIDFLDTQVSFAGGRIMPNGNVGIGTTAPSSQLSVLAGGNSATTPIANFTGSGNGKTEIFQGGNMTITGDSSTATTMLSVKTGSTEVMSVTSTQTLSIGSGLNLGTVNLGGGLFHLTTTGNNSQIKSYNDLELLPGSLSGPTSRSIVAKSGGAGYKVLVVRGATGQTANLQEWQDVNALTLASVSATGVFELGNELITAGIAQFANGGATASYSRFGTSTTGHSLSAASDLLLSGLLEVDGNAFLDGSASISSNLEITGYASISSFILPAVAGGTLGDCDAADATLNWDLTTGQFVCGTDATGGGGVSSNSLDFDELVDAMTLDANLTVASAGFTADWKPYFASNLLPSVDDTYSLGDSTHRWKDLYVASGSLHIGTNGDEAVIDYNVNDDYLAFKSDGTNTRMVITDAGNVGVGTATPATKLSVAVEDSNTNSAIDTLTLTHTVTAGSQVFAVDTGASLLNGLVSYWRMDEATGASVADAIGSNTGTAIGATVVAGKISNGRSFDGGSAYIDTPLAPSGYTGISFSAWVSLDTVGTYPMVMSYGTTAGNTPELRFYSNTGQIEFIARSSNTGVTDNTNLAGTGWHHIVGTSDGVTLRLYKDGVLVGTSNVAHTLGSATALRIGARSETVGFYLDGTIDEAGVWSRELTQQEVTDLYNSGDADALESTSGGGAGIGSSVLFKLADSAGDAEDAARVTSLFSTATNGTEASALTFSTRAGGAAVAERMRIMGDGSVGIGTTTPLTKLEVQGTASASHLLTTGTLQVAGGASVSYSRFGTSTTGHSLSAASDLLLSGQLELDGQAFFDGSASVSSNLEITGFASISSFILPAVAGGTLGDCDAADATLNWDLTTGQFVCGTDATGGGGVASDGLDFDELADAMTLDAATTIAMAGNNYSFTGTGNIGVGTSTPDAKLDIAGNILASTSGNVSLTLRSNSAIDTDGQFTILTASTSDRLDIRGGAGTLANTLMTIASSGNVGIGTVAPTARLELGAGSTTAAPLKFTSGSLLASSSAGAIEFLTDAFYGTITTGAGTSFQSNYPPAQSDTYVKATSKLDTNQWPYYATDPSKSLTGSASTTAWISAATSGVNQRFHIDLGSAVVVTRIYYENYHSSGGFINRGIENFTLWGSNDSSAFNTTTYGIDTNWTQISTTPTAFAQHVSANIADPQYITVSNTEAYRYYAVKITDNYGDSNYIGLRHIELQSGSLARKAFVLTDGVDLTPGRVPFAGVGGRLMDSSFLNFDGTNLGLGTTVTHARIEANGNILASSSGNVSLTLRSNSAKSTDGQFTILTASTSDRLDIRGGAGALANTLMTIASSGNVGLLTTKPQASFQVGATFSAGFAPIAGKATGVQVKRLWAGYDSTSTNTDLIGAVVGNLSVPTSNSLQGFESYIYSSNATGIAQKTIGLIANLEHSGLGALASGQGVLSNVFTTSSGNIATSEALMSLTQILGAGSITNAYGLRVNMTDAAAGAITRGYGVYIHDLPAVTGYGVYQVGTDDSNYFGGNVGLGALVPEQRLEVSGNVFASSSGNVDFVLRSSSTTGAANNDDSKFTIRVGSTSENLLVKNGVNLNLVTVASAGAFTVNQLSTGHGFIAAGTGNNKMTIQNTTSCATCLASFAVIADGTGANQQMFSSGYTTSGSAIASSYRILALDAGGISLVAGHADGVLRIYTGAVSTERARFDNIGRLGLGTTGPVQELHITSASEGNLLRLEDSTNTCDLDPDATLTATCTSDGRLKMNIADFGGAMDYLKDFHIREYNMINGGEHQVGVIAQELLETRPEMVHMGEDGFYKVEEVSSWVIVKGVQELDERLTVVETTLASDTGAASDSYVETYNMEAPVQEGALVALSSVSVTPFAVMTTRAYDSGIIGVVSSVSGERADVAMNGHVRVMVSLENGPIIVGDRITSSGVAGVGMKATRPGQAVGVALEPLDAVASGSYGQVLISLNVGYWAPSVADTLAGNGLNLEQQYPGLLDMLLTELRDIMNITLESGLVQTLRGVFQEVQTDKLCVGATCVTEDQLKRLLEVNMLSPATPTPTPEPTPTPSVVETPVPTPVPTDTVTPPADATPTPDTAPTTSVAPTPEPTPSPVATIEPTLLPTPDVTPEPTPAPLTTIEPTILP